MFQKPELKWQKGRDGWIPLDQLNLQSKLLNDASGIYVLWSGDNVIKIGKGRILDELVKDKTNRQITEIDGLMVTWCEVPAPWSLDDILRSLIKKLNPTISDGPILESGEEISVSAPWDGRIGISIPDKD